MRRIINHRKFIKMIGREKEKEDLIRLSESEKPEFVVVSGRRRVGKTFLIREFFGNRFAFYHTGMANTETENQLNSFNASLHKYGKIPYPKASNWLASFEQLIHLLSNTKKKGKKTVFIDEIPRMDTPRMGFVQALEYFWNSYASNQNDMLLIVCGSDSSWIMNKLINSQSNRVTHQIDLRPFNLGECEEYFKKNRIALNRHQIVENYMIFGGIPYYLSLMQKHLSMAQNIDNICFAKNGTLRNEFENLYASLFRNYEDHLKVVEVLSKKAKGMTRKEILENTRLPNGGGFTKTLTELELCGFIRKCKAFEKKERDHLFQLTDFFTMFYFNFMTDNQLNDEHDWTNHSAWSGYAFEQVCMAHVPQIKYKLGIAGVQTNTASWRSNEADNDAQFELLIVRKDKVINLCEMRYAQGQYVIDEQQDKVLRNKRSSFRLETKTRKTLRLTMITTYGIEHNEYWHNIHSEVTIDDLFYRNTN